MLKDLTEKSESNNFQCLAILERPSCYTRTKYWFLVHWLQTDFYTCFKYILQEFVIWSYTRRDQRKGQESFMMWYACIFCWGMVTLRQDKIFLFFLFQVLRSAIRGRFSLFQTLLMVSPHQCCYQNSNNQLLFFLLQLFSK